MFTVYLAVDFFQLYIDIMQKLLNTHSFALYPPLLRMLSNAKAGLMTSLTLLLLIGLAGSAKAASFGSNYINIGSTSDKAGVNGVYYTNSQGSNTSARSFNSIQDLGGFDLGTGSLFLSGNVTTTEAGGETVTSVVLLYRVYLSTATTKPAFQELALTTNSGRNTTTRSWQTSGQPNLLTAVNGGVNGRGTYILELYYRGDVTPNGNGPRSVIFDRNGLDSYTATFTVTGSRPAIWLGKSPSWTNGSNWSTGVTPDLYTDVTIPYDPNITYPHIITTVQVRTLAIQGNGSGRGATVSIDFGNLQVYGDLQDPFNGLTQTGGLFTLAGGTQTFSAVKLFDMVIQGGGQKILAEKNIQGGAIPVRMEIYRSLTFDNVAGGGIIVTGTSNPLNNGVYLNIGARLIGESEGSYVLGLLTTFRSVGQAGPPEDFGGIGVSLVANAAAPGGISVTRYTGLQFAEVGIKGASVNRYFIFNPDNPDNLRYTLTFNYLNRELNGNTAANLGLFTAPIGTTTFTSLGRGSSSDVTNKSVTVANIPNTLAATFTLGEIAPLPVTLVSFTATPTPQGAALLRWVTAKELNNKGFGIERTLGTSDTWKEVGYVATTNTPNGKSYEYTDKSLVTAPASTQAYYRLRQEDIDGTISYSPVAAVARPSVVASTNLVLSPVPVDGPNLSVAFAEAGQAGQEVAIINTQGQRMLHFTTQESAEGTLNLPVANLAAGVYIVRIQTPGQAVRHARFVKL
jgi:hypothetical protein